MKNEFEISAYVVSHIGKVRVNHEDNFLLDNGKYIDSKVQKSISLDKENEKNRYVEEQYKNKKSKKGIFAVCDGMGGCNSGEIASYIAVNKLAEYKEALLNSSDIKTSIDYFHQYVYEANKDILSYCNRNHESRGMGTTLVSLLINDHKAVVINLGDSSAFIYKNNKLEKISKTHTEGQRLLDLKILSEDELINIRSRNALTRYLGMDQSYGIPVGDISDYFVLEEKQYFLLCSDGLTNNVSEDKISEIFKHDKDIDITKVGKLLLGQALEDTAEKKGGSDNTTVLVIEVKKAKQTLIDRIINKFN